MKRLTTFYHQYIKIAVLLIIPGLFITSCTVFQIKPSTIEKASNYNNRLIKIKTIHGNVVKLRWIEDKNEYIVSIKDTKRVLIDPSSINYIRANQAIITLDSALKQTGNIQIYTENKNYNFLKVQRQDDHIIGIEKTGKEILPVAISKDQISKIKLKNKGLSMAADIGLGIVGFYIIALIF